MRLGRVNPRGFLHSFFRKLFPVLAKLFRNAAEPGAPLAFIVIVVTILIGMRFAAVATTLNNICGIGETDHLQSLLSLDLQEHWIPPEVGKWKTFTANIGKYLPPHIQMHGVLLLNNILVWLFSLVLGVHYFNLYLVALLYLLVVYLGWAFLLRKHFRPRTLYIFSALFLLAPKEYLGSSLVLLGSHPEGAAFITLMFFLVLYFQNPSGVYGCLFFSGTFFFLYKGTVVALLALVFSCFVYLQSNRKRLLGLLALISGVVPWIFFYKKFGFYALYLQDGSGADLTKPTWFNVLVTRFRPAAWRLPPFSSPAHALYLLLFISAFILLAVALVVFKEKRALLFPILVYPILLWTALSFSSLPVNERYFWTLYPFMFVIVSLGLSALPRFVYVATVALLALFLLPAQLSLIDLRHPDLFLRYRGLDYYNKCVYYVPSAAVDFVNRRMVECPKNRGYLFLPPRQLVPPRDLPRLAQQAIFFLNYCAPRPEEIETLGETIAVNLEPDEAKLNGWLSRERLVDESKRAILLAGFRQARQTRVVSNRCE